MVEIGTNAVVVAFSNDGQIVSATGGCSVERWQVKDSDGQEVGRLGSVNTTGAACAVATSKDGRWIVHADGQAVVVRNAATYPGREVFRIEEHTKPVYALDISPDSTQFASGSLDYTMRVYSITTGQRLLGPIQHEHDMLHGVKFSPSGEYIATATMHRVRVLNANTGHQLCEIPSHPITQPWAPLGWSSDSKRLFAVKEDGKVMCLEVSNSKLIREWGLPINRPGFCCLATNGRSFIACSTPSSLSFWDASSYTRIGSTIEGRGPIYSMAVSSDDRYLACCETGKITIYSLKDILPRDILLLGVIIQLCSTRIWSDSSQPSTIRLPLVELSNTAFKPWIEGNWESAEAILSQEIGSRGQHILANRALVRTHLKQWDAAIEDAKAVQFSLFFLGFLVFTRVHASPSPSNCRL